MLYHPLQRVDPICTTRILLFEITTFCPQHDENNSRRPDGQRLLFILRWRADITRLRVTRGTEGYARI